MAITMNDLRFTVMNFPLLFSGWKPRYRFSEVRVRVHTYVPLSDVVTGEKVRELFSFEILSLFKFTADPFTLQVTLLSIGVSTDGCRVKEHNHSEGFSSKWM